MGTSGKEIVIAFVERIDALLKGGTADVWDLLSTDAILQVNGTTPLSGLYRGKLEIVDIFARSVTRLVSSGSVSVIDTIGQGEQVGVLLMIRAITRRGRVYNAKGDPAGGFVHMLAGKISEFRLFPDTTQVETEIYGRRFAPNSAPSNTQTRAQ